MLQENVLCAYFSLSLKYLLTLVFLKTAGHDQLVTLKTNFIE